MSILEAIKNGDAKRAADLLDADPGLATGRTPEGVSYVCIAMYHGQPEIGRLLASKRQDLDLYEACTIGALSRVRELISEQPVTVNSFSPDGFAPVRPWQPTFSLVVRDQRESSQLNSGAAGLFGGL